MKRLLNILDEAALLEMCREAGFVYLGEELDGIVSVQVPAIDGEVSFYFMSKKEVLVTSF
jgi:hypothetical protein